MPSSHPSICRTGSDSESRSKRGFSARFLRAGFRFVLFLFFSAISGYHFVYEKKRCLVTAYRH